MRASWRSPGPTVTKASTRTRFCAAIALVRDAKVTREPFDSSRGGELEARYKPGGDLEMRNIEQVGNYALRFDWGDSHSTGIYTFRYLRSLCQCPECQSPTAGDERPELPRL